MKETHNLVKFSTYLSVSVAITILCIKIYAFLKTDSVSIFASLLDSLLDIGSSVINLLAVRYALMPADDNHRFGHDKIQDLAVFAQSIFFGASGIFVIVLAAPRIFEPSEIENNEIGIIIMLASMFLTAMLVAFQTYVIKISGSKVIKADKLHYFVDLLSNFAVLISLFISKYFNVKYADPIFAIGIAIYIIHSAYGLLADATKSLIDEEFSDLEKEEILKILKSDADIIAIHELKTRRGGNKSFIQFHMELDQNLTLLKSHEISEKIENKILRLFPDSEIIIHQDPAGIEKNVMYKVKLK
jgi:ferrous-iron efflux pump FieF